MQDQTKNINSIGALTSVKTNDFEVISTTLGRTPNACQDHFKQQILPILKTHLLGLPQGVDWMKEFLVYIVKNEVIDVKTIEYNRLVEELFPGQTTHSLSRFANDLKVKTVKYKVVRSNEPLHKICARRLSEMTTCRFTYLGNEKMANSKLIYSENIVEIYKSLIV